MRLADLTNAIVNEALKNKEYNVVRVHEYKLGSKWAEREVETDTYTDEQKAKFLHKDTLSWFRNLGGRESVNEGTFKGKAATINVSLSPCRTERKTTYFLF